jgi:hypothetical protein
MKNKLQENVDWFENDDAALEERAKLAHVLTQVTGKATDHLYPWLEAKRDSGTPPTVDEVFKFLEQIFEDPDRKLKAKQNLRKLKMQYASEFSVFQSEFLRLANTARVSRGEWKEEFHDKLYNSLQTQMEPYVADESVDFELYCHKAQQYARGLSRQGKEQSEARSKKQKSREAQAPKAPGTTQQVTKPRTDAPKPAEVKPTFNCFTCGKPGHISRECPDRAKNEAKAMESGPDSDQSGSESENDLL